MVVVWPLRPCSWPEYCQVINENEDIFQMSEMISKMIFLLQLSSILLVIVMKLSTIGKTCITCFTVEVSKLGSIRQHMHYGVTLTFCYTSYQPGL